MDSFQNKPPFGGAGDQDDSQMSAAADGQGRADKEKELKSQVTEEKLMAEIKTRSESLDAQKLEAVRGEVAEARLAQPAPAIPADVADAGVVSPQLEAEEVIKSGSTLVLPIDETTYKKGLHARIAGKVIRGTVLGVSSLAALAMWVGKIIKIAHKHTMKVIFRKPSFAASGDKATEGKRGD